jgi:hypothetical protein
LFEFAQSIDVDISPADKAMILDKWRVLADYHGDWGMEGFENLQNGVINLSTLEIGNHSQRYHFRDILPRNYVSPPIDRYTQAVIKQLLSVIEPDDRTRYWQYLTSLAHRDYRNEMFCMVFGPKNAGKSTLLSVPRLLYGVANTGALNIYRFKDEQALANVYNKRVNVCPDMAIKTLGVNAIGILKCITGGGSGGSDGQMEVKKLYADSFLIDIRIHLFFGINQLPVFSEDATQELESIGRRACLVESKKTLDSCDGFKDMITDPEFLDLMYSELLRTKSVLIKPPNIKPWVDATLKRWMINADPLMRILDDQYIATDKSTDHIGVNEVFGYVLEAMKSENLTVSKNLQAQITSALKTMGIPKGGSHKNYFYTNIQERDIFHTETVKSGTLDAAMKPEELENETGGRV